jgi:hypothetical protein
VIIPSLIILIINMTIFNYVRSSTNRVQPSSATMANNQHMHHRDMHLLRHIIIMFSIFVGGWSPVYLYSLISLDYATIVYLVFMLLAEVSLFFITINLFMYNHELREYLFKNIFKC